MTQSGQKRRPPVLSARHTNLLLLCTVVAGALTGIGAFLAGSPSERWVLTLHAVAGFSLAFLFIWKRRIIFRSVQRQGLGWWLLPSAFLLLVVLGTLASGVAWSTIGLPDLSGYSGLTIHASLGAAALFLLALHATVHFPRVARRDLAGRRAVLRYAVLGGAGFVAWRATELFTSVSGLSGSVRRFTGSRLVARFTGNDYPGSAWLTVGSPGTELEFAL